MRDAETDAPLAGATVNVRYLAILVLNIPQPQQTAADARGTATLSVATFDPRAWTISANGYIDYDRLAAGPVTPTMGFCLYRKPLPTFTIVVPNGYRGPVKIDMYPAPQPISEKPAPRDYVFHSSSTGCVRIAATPLMNMVDEYNSILARYENGQSISDDPYELHPDGIRFREAISQDYDGRKMFIFVIGTAADEKSLEKQMTDVDRATASTSTDIKSIEASMTDSTPTTVPH